MAPAPDVSVVVLAYNEEESIADCVTEVRDVLLTTGRSFEIVVVDDGSSDGTYDVLRRLKVKADIPRLLALTDAWDVVCCWRRRASSCS